MPNVLIPNERQLVRTFVGSETVRGTPVVPTRKWYGDMRVTKAQALADRQEYAGTFFSDYTPVRGAVEISGTFDSVCTFEDLPDYLRYCVKGGAAGVSDGNPTPGYAHTKRPSATVDDLDTATVEYGFDGIPWRCPMLVFPEYTVSADIDDAEAAWKWSSRIWARGKDLIGGAEGTATAATATTLTDTALALTVDAYVGGYVYVHTGVGAGQVRKVLSNTATVITIEAGNDFAPVPGVGSQFTIVDAFAAGVPDRPRETIDAPGTTLHIDRVAGGVMATTQLNGRFISFSVTGTTNLYGKRFMEDLDQYAAKLGRGPTRLTGQVRLEFNDVREYQEWKNNRGQYLQIRKLGSQINTGPNTFKEARLRVYKLHWDSMDDSTDREQNITVTWGFRGYVDPTESTIYEWLVTNKRASLDS